MNNREERGKKKTIEHKKKLGTKAVCAWVNTTTLVVTPKNGDTVTVMPGDTLTLRIGGLIGYLDCPSLVIPLLFHYLHY